MKISWRGMLGQDLALAGTSVLMVVGAMLSAFATIAWTFRLGPHMAYTVGGLGICSWILALGIFLVFLSGPQPKHGRRR